MITFNGQNISYHNNSNLPSEVTAFWCGCNKAANSSNSLLRIILSKYLKLNFIYSGLSSARTRQIRTPWKTRTHSLVPVVSVICSSQFNCVLLEPHELECSNQLSGLPLDIYDVIYKCWSNSTFPQLQSNWQSEFAKYDVVCEIDMLVKRALQIYDKNINNCLNLFATLTAINFTI